MYKYIKYLYIAFLISKYLESLDNFFFDESNILCNPK